MKAYRNAVMGLDAPQFTILEYPLIILFILIGAILLMSSSDLVSMFLAIELQSYGLYIFARNYEWSMSAGPQALNNPSAKRSYSTKISPVKVYHNVDLQKLQILAENKGKAGVYRFTNLTNLLACGKSYVGSSVNLYIRFYVYYNINCPSGAFLSRVVWEKDLVKQKTKKNYSLICRALLKYGYSAPPPPPAATL